MALPREARLRRSADITTTVRRGRRAKAGPLLVHAVPGPVAAGNGLRVATVTPRAVGTAVVRNRARRRVQGVVVDLLHEGAVVRGADVVVRFLPGSGEADSALLGSSLRRALQRLGVLGDRAGGAA